jgi:hypothetical protein
MQEYEEEMKRKQ